MVRVASGAIMRSFVLAARLGLVLLLAVPSVSASPGATLTIRGPDAAKDTAPTTLNVTLTLSDFACTRETPFQVKLSAQTSGSLQATLSTNQLVYVVPAESYAFTPYQGDATVDITMSGAGAVTVTATFESDGGDCIVVGGFPSATATFTLRSAASGPTTSPSPPGTNTTATPSTPPPTNETSPSPAPSADNSTATNATRSSNTTSAPAGNNTNTSGGVDQLPPGKGYVGDYKPPEESSKVPGPGMILMGAALAIAAFALRKR